MLTLYIYPQLKARAATQTRAISCIAGSTQGVTLEKCRLVYSIVVRLILTFAAPIWYQPKGTSEASKTPARTLAVIQNQCLRTVLGVYKATPVQVLKAEAVIAPIDQYLDRLVMRYQVSRGANSVIINRNRIIQNRLYRRRRRDLLPTPTQEKERQALDSLGYDCQDKAATATRKKQGYTSSTKTEEYQSTRVIDENVKYQVRRRQIDRQEKYKAGLQGQLISPAQ